jgi:hypothetical protein
MSLAMISLMHRGNDFHRYVGHQHFLQRAMPRRQFIAKAAGTVGLVLGSGVFGSGIWRPHLVRATPPPGPLPNPIPGGIQPLGPGTELIHFFLPGPDSEPSTITDFDGFVGVAHVTGNGTRTDASTGNTSRLFFDADMRFMQGQYIGIDGEQHEGTFCFF